MSWDRLRADSDSVLRVDLKVGEGTVRPGLMKLSHVTRRHREPEIGAVQATIILFDYPPEASNHTEPWHQAIAPLFDQPVRSEVFMLEFVENLRPATDGNLSLRPE